MTDNEPTKTCSKCQETKPLSEFSKRTGVPDGLQYSCKECANAIVSEHLKKLKPCPFCGEMPAITEHAPKINGKYQWQIGCESSRCCFNPTIHFLDTKETAIKCWNYRVDVKEEIK